MSISFQTLQPLFLASCEIDVWEVLVSQQLHIIVGQLSKLRLLDRGISVLPMLYLQIAAF